MEKMERSFPENKKPLVALQLRKQCFLGVEAEGPNKGAIVLFVPGGVTKKKFLKSSRYPLVKKIKRIYYGAGNDRDINARTLKTIASFCFARGLALDIEIDSARDLDFIDKVKDNLQIRPTLIYYHGEINEEEFNTITFDSRVDYNKHIADNIIVWMDVEKRKYKTQIDHPLFALDFFIPS